MTASVYKECVAAVSATTDRASSVVDSVDRGAAIRVVGRIRIGPLPARLGT